MFSTKKVFFIIFSLIIGYISYDVFISENFAQTKKHKKQKHKKQKHKKQKHKKQKHKKSKSAIKSITINSEPPRGASHIVWGSDPDGKVYKFNYSCDVNNNNCEIGDKILINTPVPLKKIYQGKSNIWGLSGSSGSAVYQCAKECNGSWSINGQLDNMYVYDHDIRGVNQNSFHWSTMDPTIPFIGWRYSPSSENYISDKINAQNKHIDSETVKIDNKPITVIQNTDNYLIEPKHWF